MKYAVMLLVVVGLIGGVAPRAAGAQPGGRLKLPPLDPNEPLPTRPMAPGRDAPRFEVVAALKALKPLAKVHYSFPVEPQWLEGPGDPLVHEYVRLTHSLCVRGENVTGPQLDVAVAVCAAVNQQRPDIAASIGVNYSVWHRRFPKDAPPTETGAKHDDEVAFYRSRLEQIRDWLAQSNSRRKTDVRVTAILLDCERFRTKDAKASGAAAWNDAIRAKHDEIYRVSKTVFPDARVVWYGLGGVSTTAVGSCWRTSNTAPTNILNDGWSVSLYRPHEQYYTREQMRRTVDAARAAGVKEVIPWVSLASGYRRQVEGPSWTWDTSWDYGLPLAWQLGAELNNPWYGKNAECYAPWNAAPFVCFYPGPFYPKYPHWPRYFVAYVRGANDLKQLADIPASDAGADAPGSGSPDDQAPPRGFDDPE
jgi:hypothetical protein